MKAADPERLLSLDAFRGTVVACMLFVNQLGAPVESAPRWLLHAKAYTDAYTFTDLVFPGFLFIVGVSIPLALGRRGSLLAKLLRVLTRAAALVVVGVAVEFHGDLSEANTGLSEVHWTSLLYLAVLLAFAIYPAASTPARQRLHRGLRIAGLTLLVILLLVFRGDTRADGSVPFLDPQWWGILGLIGWGYLICSLIYLAVGGRERFLISSLALMPAVYIGSQHDVFSFIPEAFVNFLDVGHLIGGLSIAVMAGVLAGQRLTSESPAKQRILGLIWQAIGLFIAGTLLRPLHGISKVPGTESYYLVASGYACAALALFYAVFDVWKVWRPPALLVRTGQNPLLAYLMQDIWPTFMALLAVPWQTIAYAYYHGSWPAACANVLCVVAFYLALVVGLGKLGLRLQL
jgi:heparan-alpha-glucosaminide N-acetyltransferase